LDSLYKSEVSWIKSNTPKEDWPEFNEEFKSVWLKDKPLGYVEHRKNWASNGSIGKWILSKNPQYYSFHLSYSRADPTNTENRQLSLRIR